jgi:KipI family sensor histidine kinase inhibitor
MSARFLPSGDSAVVVEFGERIDRGLSDRVLRLAERVRRAAVAGVIETVPTFRSLLIHYDPLVTDGSSLVAAVRQLLDSGVEETRRARLWRIPVCYAPSHAPDLEDVARRTGLGTGEVVRLHHGTRYHIYMVGFVPGFPYMGDLPSALVLPRRTDPRTRVPPGSIAIAMTMTGIYPLESPGGWHLVGTTPARLFDPRRPRPVALGPGDAVQFEPVTAAEFDALAAAVAADAYEIPSEAIAA